MNEEKLLICRPCGYVMKESELGDVCPACGLPRKVFVEYKERMSSKRYMILNLNLHPIMVHFPQAILVFSLIALIINIVCPNFHPDILLGAVRYAAFVFTFVVLGTFLSGVIDGKIRFKALSPPLLKKKMIYGVIMFSFSMFTHFVAKNGVEPLHIKLILLAIGGVSMYCGILLGHWGKRLMNIGLGGVLKIGNYKI